MCAASSSFAQTFDVYRLDASQFPTVKAYYDATNAAGNSILTLETKHFIVRESNGDGPFMDVTPSNTSIMVPYSIGLDVSATFELVDQNGQLVQRFTVPATIAGIYEWMIDTSSISSGLYALRMTSGSFTSTKIVSIVR